MSLRDKILTAAAVAASALFSPGLIAQSHALTETVLYTACPAGVCNGTTTGPVLKVGSSLFGVGGGGTHSAGVVWRYGLNTGNYRVLYNFCSVNVGGQCFDGSGPVGKLVVDTAGNLYGVTSFGGGTAINANAGTVWELVKPTSGSTWTLNTLYNFCPAKSGGMCIDGNDPQAGLSYAGASSGTAYNGTDLLFGTTLAGGIGGLQGEGTLYAMQPGTGGAFSHKVLYKFCNTCGGFTNAEFVQGQFYVDGSDNIFGTSIIGGVQDVGAAWEASPTGDPWADPWTEKLIYNFCWAGGSCSDGTSPNGLIVDSTGGLWGTAFASGSHSHGTIFRLDNPGGCTEGGVATFWCISVKHQFCASASCTDGAEPNGDLDIDGSDVVYGTTKDGGSNANDAIGSGVAFSQSGTTETVLHTFCASTCTDGAKPLAGPTVDASGNLYGTTPTGGDTTSDAGVLYKLN